jgi:hypothetical protein
MSRQKAREMMSQWMDNYTFKEMASMDNPFPDDTRNMQLGKTPNLMELAEIIEEALKMETGKE